MKIAFTHNLKKTDAEFEAEFDTKETIQDIKKELEELGHEVHLLEVSGPPSRIISRLEALMPDLIFNTAEGKHGRFREAFYPAIFEELGIPYTGSDAYTLNLTLDKELTKKALWESNIPMPKSRILTKKSDFSKGNLALKFPVIVKPNFEGSSKGIDQNSVVESEELLKERIDYFLNKYPAGVLVEEYIQGVDVTIGMIAGLATKNDGVLIPTEYVIAPEYSQKMKYNIYDYALKNTYPDYVSIRVPAKLSEKTEKSIIKYAKAVFDVLQIKDFGRADFRVTDSGEVYFIEVNALPSLESGSSIFEAVSYLGLGNRQQVFQKIIKSACRRYQISPSKKKSDTRKKLRVGFAYNEKRLDFKDSPLAFKEAEFDSPKTLNAIRETLASFGFEVVDLEATPNFPEKLLSSQVDFVFNIAEGIRGGYRESQVPAILDLMDIEYTGSDASTLALTLDKGLAKKIVSDLGVKTPKSQVFLSTKDQFSKDLTFPVVIKPVSEGSSKGIMSKSVCHTKEEALSLIKDVIEKYNQGALVEEYLPGREFTVALLGEKRPKVLSPMEIVFSKSAGEFPIYHYEHKQESNDQVRYEVPAKIDDSLRKRLKSDAKKVFHALKCRDFARIDFRLDAKGAVNFIECNPLPGLTPNWSDLCLIANASNIDYQTLIGEIISPAIKRLKTKRKHLMNKDKVSLPEINEEE